MSKLNWDNVRDQGRAQKYGIEIDYAAGEKTHYRKAAKPISVKQVFIPKTIVRTKEEQVTVLIAEIKEWTLRLNLKISNTSKLGKQEAASTFNKYAQKLVQLRNDEEINQIIIDARSALHILCSKPDLKQVVLTGKKKKQVKLNKQKKPFR